MKANKERIGRLSQGDILRDVEHVEQVEERDGIIEISRVIFPFAMVLTQDCDLAQDPRMRGESSSAAGSAAPNDKWLLSVLLAPMYNAEHLFAGQHLTDLKMTMQRIPSDPKRKLKQNEIPRYHYMEFTDDTPIPAVVVDFKHYFSANTEYLQQLSLSKLLCRIPFLFREDVSQRFANYLSRIALPMEDELLVGELVGAK